MSTCGRTSWITATRSVAAASTSTCRTRPRDRWSAPLHTESTVTAGFPGKRWSVTPRASMAVASSWTRGSGRGHRHDPPREMGQLGDQDLALLPQRARDRVTWAPSAAYLAIVAPLVMLSSSGWACTAASAGAYRVVPSPAPPRGGGLLGDGRGLVEDFLLDTQAARAFGGVGSLPFARASTAYRPALGGSSPRHAARVVSVACQDRSFEAHSPWARLGGSMVDTAESPLVSSSARTLRFTLGVPRLHSPATDNGWRSCARHRGTDRRTGLWLLDVEGDMSSRC